MVGWRAMHGLLECLPLIRRHTGLPNTPCFLLGSEHTNGGLLPLMHQAGLS